jgi:hypothetical protein
VKNEEGGGTLLLVNELEQACVAAGDELDDVLNLVDDWVKKELEQKCRASELSQDFVTGGSK